MQPDDNTGGSFHHRRRGVWIRHSQSAKMTGKLTAPPSVGLFVILTVSKTMIPTVSLFVILTMNLALCVTVSPTVIPTVSQTGSPRL